MKILATAALLAILNLPANAAFYNGNEVFNYCATNRSFVNGFVAGVFDKAETDSVSFFTYVLMAPAKSGAPGFDSDNFIKYSNEIQQYCTPNGATLAQVSDIYCQYLGANPATRHLSAAVLFGRALSRAWPCAPAKP